MGKNRLNRILSIIALLAVVAMLFGLFSRFDTWGGQKPEKGVELPIIKPSESETSASRMVKLYFRCTDQPYLSSETRKVDVRADERLETAVLRELYKGPSSARPELEALIHTQTRTVAVTDSDDTLIVTISAEFLQPPKPLPENWAEDLVLREEAMLRAAVGGLFGGQHADRARTLCEYSNPSWIWTEAVRANACVARHSASRARAFPRSRSNP